MNGVRVTAADFNGRTFDGCPFDHIPQWLIDAENDDKLKIHPYDTDYAMWKVLTPDGEKIAGPGDYIVKSGDDLLVMDKTEYMIAFL
jgi:hypothetical protein